MTELYSQLIFKFDITDHPAIILVDISQQTLSLIGPDSILYHWPVSTAKAGIGNQINSYQTPLGAHTISEKIGQHEPLHMLFEARQPTGKLAKAIQSQQSSGLDQITSRILWLKGLEPNINLGGKVDTHERFIYIHGTAEEGLIGQAVSHGCIRMRNADIAELFDLVNVGTPVYICESQNTLNLV